MSKFVLVINPGSTSTKIAVFEDEKQLFFEKISHDHQEISTYLHIMDQYKFRKEMILNSLDNHQFDIKKLDAVCGRGGMLKPIESGIYLIEERMLEELKIGKHGEHASNLGAIIAYNIASVLNIPAYIVDPV